MDRAAGYASHLDRIGAETIGATARLISTERSFTKFRCVPNLQELSENLMLAIDSFGLTNIPYCMQYPLYVLHWETKVWISGREASMNRKHACAFAQFWVTLGRGRIVYDFRGCHFRLSREFKFNERWHVEPIVDLFNLTNGQTVISEVQTVGPNYKFPSNTINPFLARFGLRFNF